MKFRSIVCLPDLLRGTKAFSHSFFDLVREPIRQGAGFDIGYPPDSKLTPNLSIGFSLETFLGLIDPDSEDPTSQWHSYYYRLPNAALDYLKAHIPPESLVLAFEMPPWLLDLCQSNDIPFIDMRISPLRFGSDLYIALRSNYTQFYQRIRQHQVLPEELRLEAHTLSANVRMHQQRLEENQRYPFNLDEKLIFIGQAPYDASLLSTKNHTPLTCLDFSDQLKTLARGRQIMHKPHPLAMDHAAQERSMLQEILQTEVRSCWQNAYQILSCQHDVILTGISSGMLQEAEWFDQSAHMLFQPFTPLAKEGAVSLDSYQQVHFDTWISPGFWHQILVPERSAPRISKLAPHQHHHARQTFDHWWDYAKVMTWERSLAIESFERSGGIVLRQRTEALEQGLKQNRYLVMDCDEDNRVDWPPSANMRGKITIRGTGNIIRFNERMNFDATIDITGNNNVIEIGDDCRFFGKIYVYGSGGTLSIGDQSTFARAYLKCMEGRKIHIGKDCMFSFNIEVRTTDGHSIVDPVNGKRLNPAEDIFIGDHVWVGMESIILKGSHISSNSIIGAASVVNNQFEHEQSIIAGTPAKQIKQGVTWHRDLKEEFSTEELDAWKISTPHTYINAQTISTNLSADDHWEQHKALALEKFAQSPQAFGRGSLYQAHEEWGVMGQRPTLARLHTYGIRDFLPAQAEVLDIGCNIGLIGLTLSPAIKSYDGFDNNPVLIEVANILANGKKINNCRYHHLTFTEFITSNTKQYDVVFSFAVHVWIGLSMAAYVMHLYSLTKPNGIVVIESNDLAKNDHHFFSNIQAFIDHGFILLKQGLLKDDGIIERGFCIMQRKA